MPAATRVGDKSQCPADAHGCPGCPHSVIGPAVSGSPNVFINGKPALRVGDPGIHAACCGSNTWQAIQGSPNVFINGKPAHRLGDADQHCGGIGRMIEGSQNVFINENEVAPLGVMSEKQTTTSQQDFKQNRTETDEKGVAHSGVISQVEASTWIQEFRQNRPDIPFDWPRDCCYARAREMANALRAKGITVKKIWNYAPEGEVIRVNTPNVREGYVEWWYHVSVMVPVRHEDGSVSDMVLDPSLSNRPLTRDEWKQMQGNPASTLAISDADVYFRDPDGSTIELDPGDEKVKEKLARHRAEKALEQR